jgi:hypothetical protein
MIIHRVRDLGFLPGGRTNCETTRTKVAAALNPSRRSAGGHDHVRIRVPAAGVHLRGEDKLVLGTSQQIFPLKCDVRERQRTLVVTIVGD